MSKKQDISQLPVQNPQPSPQGTQPQQPRQPMPPIVKALIAFMIGSTILAICVAIFSQLFSGSNPATPTAAAQAEATESPAEEVPPAAKEEPTATPEPTNTPPPVPTDTPVAELAFADIIQHPDEKSWSSTQLSAYHKTIIGQRVNEWIGTVLEVDKFAGEPYVSLDMESGEPAIDVYVYIKEEDLLKVGLGQEVTFAGIIDSTWPEDNGFYALQIKQATLLELGEVPTPTPKPSTPTPEPTDTPAAPLAGDVPLEVALYATEISEPVNSLVTAMGDLGTLLQNPKIGDDNWTLQAATQVTIIRLAHEQLTQVTPPAEMEEVHSLLLEATSDCNESMDYLVSGIDNLNAEDMETAGQLILQCGEKMQEPSRLMAEYQTGQDTSEETEAAAAPTPTDAPAAPTPVPAPPTDTPAPPPPPAQLSKDSALGVQKQVGDWGMKLYQVKKAKAVYHFGEADIAQGVYLMPFVEFTNMSSGTKAPIEDLDLYIVDGAGNRYDLGFSDGDLGAAHQFQAGHVYDDIDPGVLLGIVMPADVPEGIGDTWLKVDQDPAFVMYLGDASTLPME